jgi:hypothetical protein
METIQIVIDTPLRKEADRLAKKSKVNRPELFRELLRAHLKQARIREMEEREIRAYEKMPDTLDDWGPWETEARPVVVLTRDNVIARLSRVTVVPITTTVRETQSEVVLDLDDGMKNLRAINLHNTVTVTQARPAI